MPPMPPRTSGRPSRRRCTCRASACCSSVSPAPRASWDWANASEGEGFSPPHRLPITESVQLFTYRAAEIRRQFVLDDDTAPVVEQLCQALDGLPLAIELAAARVRSLSVREIARRLDDRFALLRDPTSRSPERRRVLAAAIAWSYELLFPDDQRGLQALSC